MGGRGISSRAPRRARRRVRVRCAPRPDAKKNPPVRGRSKKEMRPKGGTDRRAARRGSPPRASRSHPRAVDVMSWIYGSAGGTSFWDEQIKKEKQLKKTWASTYGVELANAPREPSAEEREKAELEAKAIAKAEAEAAAKADRAKLWKVTQPVWKTKCGPTGASTGSIV